MRKKGFIRFFKKHWLKFLGAGFSIGGMAIDNAVSEREMVTLKRELKKEILLELRKENKK